MARKRTSLPPPDTLGQEPKPGSTPLPALATNKTPATQGSDTDPLKKFSVLAPTSVYERLEQEGKRRHIKMATLSREILCRFLAVYEANREGNPNELLLQDAPNAIYLELDEETANALRAAARLTNTNPPTIIREILTSHLYDFVVEAKTRIEQLRQIAGTKTLLTNDTTQE